MLIRKVDSHLAALRAGLHGPELELAERLARCLRELVLCTAQASAADRGQVRVAVHYFVLRRESRGRLLSVRSLAAAERVVDRVARQLGRPDLLAELRRDRRIDDAQPLNNALCTDRPTRPPPPRPARPPRRRPARPRRPTRHPRLRDLALARQGDIPCVRRPNSDRRGRGGCEAGADWVGVGAGGRFWQTGPVGDNWRLIAARRHRCHGRRPCRSGARVLVLLILHLVAALAAPLLVRWWGPRACYPLALAPAAAFCWALARTPAVGDGGAVVETYPWIRQLGLDIALRLTTLSWLMTLLIGGVGALVLVYSARYFDAGSIGLAQFAAVLVAFAGAMLVLVFADDLLLLYVGWELTTIFSYLLIGHSTERRSSRWAAAQALTVTTLGGLAMLVGFIMLGEHAGTLPLVGDRRTATARRRVPGGRRAADPGRRAVQVGDAAVQLLAAGRDGGTHAGQRLPARRRHGQGRRLPGRAARAGARRRSARGGRCVQVARRGRPCCSAAGRALRQTDLKLLLAYGTVSQLGLLIAVTGSGTPDAALAGTAMLLAHALFKAALFLVVGIIDHGAGTRDLRELVRAAALVPAAVRGRRAGRGVDGRGAAAGRLRGQGGGRSRRSPTSRCLLAGLVAGTVLTVAYSARFLWGAFADRPGVAPVPPGPIAASLLVPPRGARRASVCSPAPAAASLDDGLLRPYADLLGGVDAHLALWPGPTPALGLSVLALVGGGLLFAVRGPLAPVLARLPVAGGGQPGVRVGRGPVRPAGHRGHRRDPARLPAAVSGHHPGHPGAGARRGDALRRPVAGADSALGQPAATGGRAGDHGRGGAGGRVPVAG